MVVDGFLFFEGRLSRFSKICGEMVPHETIEQKIVGALTTEEHSERFIAVLGVADEAKGEALVLLSSIEIDLPALRSKLSDTGTPNLWIPKIVRRVDAIPVLGSGKLDLATCKRLVEQV
jgi:acyl-[acyl-carrier-protein]-phospholipid O-acyltransferase/long-chain-fatty-acid--[acyl-carrier-protein] ligase